MKVMRSQSGFSIVEFMVGAVILALFSVIATSNYTQNVRSRKFDTVRSMTGREVDPVIRGYFEQHILERIMTNGCRLAVSHLKFPPASAPLPPTVDPTKVVRIAQWTNNAPSLVESASKCEGALSKSGTDARNAKNIRGCVRLGNLRSITPPNKADFVLKDILAYVEFDLSFERILATSDVGITCGSFANNSEPATMEVFYTVYWLDRSNPTEAHLVKYSNTMNFNNR